MNDNALVGFYGRALLYLVKINSGGDFLRILLSNDDGVEAQGIEALVKALHKEHEVIVSAPMQQQSGMAHALTVGQPMEVARCERLERTYGIEAWSVGGTPTDSVKLYLEAIGERQPDLVVSGINHGANLATDILYSGTVGAAMEGYLHDVNAMALSLDINSQLSYEEAAELFAADLSRFMQEEKQPFFFNINFPQFLKDDRPQYVFGRQGKRDYINAFQKEERDGRMFYTMAGDIYDSDKGSATDIYAIEAGYISVTPLITDLTDYMELEERLRK
jgi:5'-nucleotidase